MPIWPIFRGKLDRLFEIAKSVEIVIILGRIAGFHAKIVPCCHLCPNKEHVQLSFGVQKSPVF